MTAQIEILRGLRETFSSIVNFEPVRNQKLETRNLKQIDLNCDLGEGMTWDNELMPFISSANIACGYHAGDEEVMQRTVELALIHNVAIGAHPSFPDRENFGRKEMDLEPNVLYDIIVLQIKILDTIAEMAGTTLHHVKPHGALYNMAARDTGIAATIARAVKDIDNHLILYGLSGSQLIKEAKSIGLKTASEVFADRTYQNNGTLTSRAAANALITDEKKSLKQVLQMLTEGKVTTTARRKIPIIAETICIHGDGENAVAFAKKISETLKKENFKIESP